MHKKNIPKVTFGVIVLNGEPFTRYCLRMLYPFAHQIIVVEGACEKAKSIATPQGHSTDATLEVLKRFKEEEDPEDKLRVITKHGFWNEKNEMSQAYAQAATGDYLWQVDIDEFYKSEDMETILEILQNDPEITSACFRQIIFWGGFDYKVDGWLFHDPSKSSWAKNLSRLFKWGPGYKYVTHRPPTVHDPKENDLSTIKCLTADELFRQNIVVYHYSLVFPKQVEEKCKYYIEASKLWRQDCSEILKWYKDVFLHLKNPYTVHNVYQVQAWLERYKGTHPNQIDCLRRDIEASKIEGAMRRTDDIERVLRSPAYYLGKRYKKLRLMLRVLKQ